MPYPWLIIGIIGSVASIVSLIYAELQYGLIARLASRLFFSSIDDVITRKWSEDVKIRRNGNMEIMTTMNGKVNYGELKEKEIEIESTAQSKWGDLHFWARNETTGEQVNPLAHIHDPHFKRISLPIDGCVRTGQKFKISYGYTLPKNFGFKNEGFYCHRAYHNERLLRITLRFDNGLIVSPSSVRGYEKTCGGIRRPLAGDNKPKLTTSKPCTIQLVIQRARKGSVYEICWLAKKNDRK